MELDEQGRMSFKPWFFENRALLCLFKASSEKESANKAPEKLLFFAGVGWQSWCWAARPGQRDRHLVPACGCGAGRGSGAVGAVPLRAEVQEVKQTEAVLQTHTG